MTQSNILTVWPLPLLGCVACVIDRQDWCLPGPKLPVQQCLVEAMSQR
jgi:hypothetical protein